MKVLQALAAVAIALLTAVRLPAAGGAWLDAPLAGWNIPGATPPKAPPAEGTPDPRCREQARPAVGAEDRAIMSAGWALVGPLQVFGGTSVVTATSAFDGMCRWWGYQVFVFVDGRFAGTLSPEPMNSRTDGAVVQIHLYHASSIMAEFTRYTGTDPLCCPSGRSFVNYRVDHRPGGPMVRAVNVSTTPSKAP